MKRLWAIVLVFVTVTCLVSSGSDNVSDKQTEEIVTKTELTDTVNDGGESTGGSSTNGSEESDSFIGGCTDAIDIYRDILLGDVSRIKSAVPDEVWEYIGEMNSMSAEEMVDAVADGYTAMSGVFETAEYTVVYREDASDKLGEIETALKEYGYSGAVDGAEYIEVEWEYTVAEEYRLEFEGGADSDCIYAVLLDGNVYCLDENYLWLIAT